MTILPSLYFGNIYYFNRMFNHQDIYIDVHEHFTKQSLRNRNEIFGANGKLNLIVPIKKWKNHTAVGEICIANNCNWQTLHWRSITSAYRSSPYFEFYEHELSPLFQTKYDLLIDWNQKTFEAISRLMKEKFDTALSEKYFDKSEVNFDYRNVFNPKFQQTIETPKYYQVFNDKLGFINNLSIIDLLFNLGPEAVPYLKKMRDTHTI